MSVADGVGHGLFLASLVYSSPQWRGGSVCCCGLSQSLAQCSAAAALWRFGFGRSLRWVTLFQILICAAEQRVSGCVYHVFGLCLRSSLASCKALVSSSATHLRWSGPGEASLPLPILLWSTGGPSPKKYKRGSTKSPPLSCTPGL